MISWRGRGSECWREVSALGRMTIRMSLWAYSWVRGPTSQWRRPVAPPRPLETRRPLRAAIAHPRRIPYAPLRHRWRRRRQRLMPELQVAELDCFVGGSFRRLLPRAPPAQRASLRTPQPGYEPRDDVHDRPSAERWAVSCTARHRQAPVRRTWDPTQARWSHGLTDPAAHRSGASSCSSVTCPSARAIASVRRTARSAGYHGARLGMDPASAKRIWPQRGRGRPIGANSRGTGSRCLGLSGATASRRGWAGAADAEPRRGRGDSCSRPCGKGLVTYPARRPPGAGPSGLRGSTHRAGRPRRLDRGARRGPATRRFPNIRPTSWRQIDPTRWGLRDVACSRGRRGAG